MRLGLFSFKIYRIKVKMFIIYAGRRINFSLVKEYKATEKTTNDKTYYTIDFKFLDDKIEQFHFFEDKEKRDEYLKKLDENVRI